MKCEKRTDQHDTSVGQRHSPHLVFRKSWVRFHARVIHILISRMVSLSYFYDEPFVRVAVQVNFHHFPEQFSRDHSFVAPCNLMTKNVAQIHYKKVSTLNTSV